MVSLLHVARLARAWIETPIVDAVGGLAESPASRGRGLKPVYNLDLGISPMSPASRGRGLKLSPASILAIFFRRPPRAGVD